MSIIWYMTNTLISCLWLVSIHTIIFRLGWLGKYHFPYILFYIQYDYIFDKKQKHLSTMCLTQISVNWNILYIIHKKAQTTTYMQRQPSWHLHHVHDHGWDFSTDVCSWWFLLHVTNQPTKPPKQLAEGGDLRESTTGNPLVCVAIPVFTASLGTISDTLNCNCGCAYDNNFPSWLKTLMWANWRPLAE